VEQIATQLIGKTVNAQHGFMATHGSIGLEKAQLVMTDLSLAQSYT